jgi:hypothetical protein
MEERLRGTGMLRHVTDSAIGWDVGYEFTIRRGIIQQAGFPTVVAQSSSHGSVWSLSGDAIRRGYYELTTEDGETLRVKNLGVDWAIIAPRL